MEIQAAASLFQVPIYERVQSTTSDSYHREVNHPVVGAKSSHQVKIKIFYHILCNIVACSILLATMLQ